MNFPNLCLLSFNQLLQHLLLLADDDTELGVDDLGVQLAPHQRGAFVVLDVALVDRLGEFDVLAEALFLKVPDGKLVGESEEVENSIANVVILKLILFFY